MRAALLHFAFSKPQPDSAPNGRDCLSHEAGRSSLFQPTPRGEAPNLDGLGFEPYLSQTAGRLYRGPGKMWPSKPIRPDLVAGPPACSSKRSFRRPDPEFLQYESSSPAGGCMIGAVEEPPTPARLSGVAWFSDWKRGLGRR